MDANNLSIGGELESASTTFGIAVLSFLSQDDVIFILGAILVGVRITYECVRLWYYITDHKRKDQDDG
jgi:hypothetical protein